MHQVGNKQCFLFLNVGTAVVMTSMSHFTCRCENLRPEDLPPEFIKVVKNRNNISCTTADLVSE